MQKDQWVTQNKHWEWIKKFKTTNELKVGDHISLKVVVIVKICNEFLHFEGY
jgi:DNA-directed RNA polymerase subunit E'/Rpb7